MRERPILFSGPMVRAILDERKTQTRRVMKPQLEHGAGGDDYHGFFTLGYCTAQSGCLGPEDELRCPYGQPGDRLWVRETWGIGCRPCHINGWRDGVEYRADCADLDDVDLLPLHEPAGVPDNFYADYEKTGWQSSIHMFRWMSRILLEVTGVWVKRVQEISEDDALREGAPRYDPDHRIASYIGDWFAPLWDSINAKRGYSWESNPWVWKISFQVLIP